MTTKGFVVTVATLAVFVTAVAIKSAGYNLLGASPVSATEITFTGRTFWVGALYYALTLAGIAAGLMFDALGALPDQTVVTAKFILDSLRSAKSWRGLIASPLVFLTVYVGVKSSPVTTAFVLLAFQNGFFWKAAMSRIMNDQHG